MRYLAILLALLCTPVFSHAGASKPKVTLRVCVEVAGILQPEQTVTVQLEKPPIQVTVPKIAEASDKSLLSIESSTSLPGAYLLTFNQSARKELLSTTSLNMGKRLIVFISNRPVFAPLIDSPLPNGRILVPEGITPTEAAELAKIAQKNAKREKTVQQSAF